MEEFDKAKECSEFILQRIKRRPKIAVVCGTGLQTICQKMEIEKEFKFSELPHFPSGVNQVNHSKTLCVGDLGGKDVFVFLGRIHFYEVNDVNKVVFPIRLCRCLGVETIIMSNAAGGLNPEFNVGDIMIIRDHINLVGLSGFNPLVGVNDDRFGSRFTSMSRSYDKNLCCLFEDVVKDLKVDLTIQHGIQATVSGPVFETPSEHFLLRNAGASSVCMSTANEVCVARHCGINVFAFALITDKCHLSYKDDESDPLTEDKLAISKSVNETDKKMSPILQIVVEEFLRRI